VSEFTASPPGGIVMVRKRFILLSLVWVTLGLLVIENTFANVSLRNGNFYLAYKDIIYPGGFEPTIDRIFNSKTGYKGWFGWGWGNSFEVYLTVSADASVVVHEYGGGAENRFIPLTTSAAEVDSAISSISDEARKVGLAPDLAQYRTRLKNDVIYRNEQWERFVSQGKLKPKQLTVGTQLKSIKYSYQFITKVANGYVRKWESGKTEYFNEAGKLAMITDRNKNFIKLTYRKDGHIESLIDNFNRKMFFEFNKNGYLSRIEGENRKVATYEYNDKGELIKSKDVDNHTYTYKYDKRHNLIESGHVDGTKLQVDYYALDKEENVKRVIDRDGKITDYAYENIGGPDHLIVTITETGPGGKGGKTVSKYEYVFKHKPDGQEWTQKLVSTVNGDRTETVYNEACELPDSITRGGERATFKYDAKCHVVSKETPEEITNLRYDPQAGKVSYVERFRKEGGKQKLEVWAKYRLRIER
jgi:YD repeat-containing protein